MSGPILVCGAGGFIGQHLVRRLAHAGERVIAVSRSDIRWDLANVEKVTAALRDASDFSPLVARSSKVVYLASTSTPGTSAGHPLAELTDNLQPLAALLQVLQDYAAVEVLYFSSGGSLYTSTSDIAATEMSEVRPRSYHGAGKIAAEHFISAWCNQYAGRATILRPSNVYGPGQPERIGFGIVPAALGKIRRQELLHVWGDGSVVRDYLYVDDLVALAEAILSRQMPVGAQLVNACSGIGVSLNELFSVMEAATGRPLKRSYEPGRELDASRVTMDHDFARRTYGWSPATTLREGLERTWASLNSTTQ